MLLYPQGVGVPVECHGDDVTALGTERRLDLYERGMLKSFDCELRGGLGGGPNDIREIKIRNRILKSYADGSQLRS